MGKDSRKSAIGAMSDVLVIVSLVNTLTDSFGNASNLYRKLRTKEKRFEEEKEAWKERQRRGFQLRRDPSSDEDRAWGIDRRSGRGRSRRRGSEDSDEESLYSSGDRVRAEYERGYHQLGQRFAVGDLIAQNQLQSQIIALQHIIISIYQDCTPSYGSTRNPTSCYMADLMQTTRAARARSIEALASQYQRMLMENEIPRLPPIGGAITASAPSSSKEIVISTSRRRRDSSSDLKPRSRSRPRRLTFSSPPKLFCLYASDLQQYPDQPVADAYKSGGDRRCPYCKFCVPTNPRSAWEIVKVDEVTGQDRKFLIENRFVVKCHREGGGFACSLCSRFADGDTAMDTVGQLADHVWRDHRIRDLVMDCDIVEADD